VVERYTRTSPDVISYEATIEDPEVFTRPWKIQHAAVPASGKERAAPGFQVRTEFVEELLYGQYRKNPLKQAH
jgi:hypothetical protein